MPDTETRFAALVGQIIEPLRRYLARRTDADTAEDVLAEVLLVCWRRRDDIPTEPLPWAYVVARHCLANADRSRRRRERLTFRLQAVEPAVAAPDDPADHGALHLALRQLRPADAEVLRLWAWEELTVGEIATVLEVSENAAAIRLHRAKRRLREQLGKPSRRDGHNEGERRQDR